MVSMSIQIFNDDSLLDVFYHCRPIHLDQDEDDDSISRSRERSRGSERWWYNIAQVCRRWRFLVLASAPHLNLYLVCTFGTPVAEMLANSPPLPLAINYVDENRELTAEDERGILLALQHRRRIRRVRLCIPVANLRNVILAMDGEFQMLEYLFVKSLADDKSVILPETFQAPLLRRLILRNIAHSFGMFRHDPPPPPPAARVQFAEISALFARRSGPQLWRCASLFSTCFLVYE